MCIKIISYSLTLKTEIYTMNYFKTIAFKINF